jgi:hypothetical protein
VRINNCLTLKDAKDFDLFNNLSTRELMLLSLFFKPLHIINQPSMNLSPKCHITSVGREMANYPPTLRPDFSMSRDSLDGSAMRIIMASSHFYKIKGKGGTDPGGRQHQLTISTCF